MQSCWLISMFLPQLSLAKKETRGAREGLMKWNGRVSQKAAQAKKSLGL